MTVPKRTNTVSGILRSGKYAPSTTTVNQTRSNWEAQVIHDARVNPELDLLEALFMNMCRDESNEDWSFGPRANLCQFKLGKYAIVWAEPSLRNALEEIAFELSNSDDILSKEHFWSQ